jgi:hypothetical protein
MNDTTRAPAAAIAAKDLFFAGWLLDNITSSFLFSRPKKEKKKALHLSFTKCCIAFVLFRTCQKNRKGMQSGNVAVLRCAGPPRNRYKTTATRTNDPPPSTHPPPHLGWESYKGKKQRETLININLCASRE